MNTNLSYQYKHSRLIARRALSVLIIFSVIASFLIAVLFKMEFINYDEYQRRVLDQISVGGAMKADRGKIYDANGNILAENKSSWRIFISPVDIKMHKRRTGEDLSEKIARGLSEILGADYQSVLDKAKKSSTIDQTIKRGADEDTKNRVLAFVSENGLEDMVHTEVTSARYYPLGSFASHVLGFTGSDNQGLFGIEAYYNEQLTGKDGKYIYTKDAKGGELPLQYISYEKPVDGADLTTTIDMYIQRVVEENIERAIEETGARSRVTCAVMEVNTGAILAMATGPSFDLNSPYTLDSLSLAALSSSGFAEGSDEYAKLKNELLYTMWNNKTVSEIYEPGSTFKVITASVALDSHAITQSNRFNCPGYHIIGGYRIACHKRTGHGGGITFAYGLQQSCNPTMMQAIARVGAKTFYDYYQRFGYLSKSGIDLPSEAKGLFHTYEGLGTTELATASFGQRFKVSPISHLAAIAAVANGGYLVTPHVVDKITALDGEIIFKFEETKGERVISEETSREVSAILEGGVSGDGGARNARVVGYKIAAKTGTSQKFDDATGDDTGNRIGSCIAFAPSDNAKIAMIFIVDEPTCQNKYGSMVAAPYISRILEKILPYLGYEREAGTESGDIIEIDSFMGLEISEAVERAKNQGLTVYVNGDKYTPSMNIYGTVTAQNPPPTAELGKDSRVVYLYTDEYQIYEETEVPDVVGKTLYEANAILTNAGLNIKLSDIGYVGGDLLVCSQSIAAGEKVKKGTVISLTLLCHITDD